MVDDGDIEYEYNEGPPVKELQFNVAHKPGTWRCELFGTGAMGLGLHSFPPDKVPNWFWRKMQWLFFGNKWIYNGDE